MNRRELACAAVGRYLVTAVTAFAGLAACGALQSTANIPKTTSPASRAQSRIRLTAPSASYHVLYQFEKRSHGQHPVSGLISVNGTLYGTTLRGGSSGNGTVFSLSPTGHEHVLHSFRGGADGAWPRGNLLDVNGTLYGTTAKGGGSGCKGDGCGTVYSVTTSGSEHVLYSFAGGADGATPLAGLINVNGTLYGTTASGGPYYNSGTVFSITTSGSETVLYRFRGGYDGEFPYSSLIDVNGTLYGTTYNGGTGTCLQAGECGTVFSVTTSGVHTVLYSFKGEPDGAFPQSNLIDVKGTLYGTTTAGGNSCLQYGCGTVFSITTAGVETVLTKFGQDNAGWDPEAGLIAVKGRLYGTTLAGGPADLGTVYSVNTAGVETLLYSFGNLPDGRSPQAGLVYSKGTLYGTTPVGGTACGADGCGTVFALSPP